jgi:hypothetical protein
MRRIAWLLLCLLFCLVGQAGAEERTWTNTQGGTFRAEFLREVDGDVTFLKQGKLVTISLDQFCEADQKLIRGLEAAKKLEEPELPAGAPRKEPSPPDGGADPRSPFQPKPDAKPSLTNKRVAPETRIWRDLRGNQTTAKFVRMHGRDVILLRAGRVVPIAFYFLSRDDRQYVRDLLAARGEEGQVPQPPPDFQESQPEPAPIVPMASSVPPIIDQEAGGVAVVVESNIRPALDGDAIPFQQPMQQQVQEQTRQQIEEMQSGLDERMKQNAEAGQRATDHVQDMRQRLQVVYDMVRQPEQANSSRPRLNPGAMLIVLPIGAAIISLLSAFLLRAAAQWVLGEDVPYGEAYSTMFLVSLINGFLRIGLGLAGGEGTSSFMMVPVSFLILSGVISSRLRTTFGAACLVALALSVITLVLFFVIGGIFFVVMRMTS